uniref:ATP-dependent zinc metalloprotease FTSH 4, mitochondrial n=1 Tax=Lygus hesperus TaxID=30085 RepID=A0A0A9XFN3_LYGHE
MEENDTLLSRNTNYGSIVNDDPGSLHPVSIDGMDNAAHPASLAVAGNRGDRVKQGTIDTQKCKDTKDNVLSILKSKYNMKNHMANERTFFKYLFTGIHIGGIGTLVLSYFTTNDIRKIYLVLFIWIIAFCFMFWGLYNYYKRKWMMESGLFKATSLLNPHTPAIVTVTFIYIVVLIIAYALVTNQYPSRHLYSHRVSQPVVDPTVYNTTAGSYPASP